MQMVKAATQCETCGRYDELEFYHSGPTPIRLGTDCAACGGRAMTIGYWGNVPGDPEFNTVLRIATQEDLRRIAEALEVLRGDRGATVEEVAQAVEAVGTDLAYRVAAWVRENGGWFQVAVGTSAIAGLVVALIMLVQAASDDPEGPDVKIEKIVIRDDGQLVLPPETDASE